MKNLLSTDPKIINDIVVEALKLIHTKRKNHKEAVHLALKKYRINNVRISRIVTGKVHWILKYLYFLDYIINKILKNTSLEQLNPYLRSLLELATFEMIVRNVKPPIATDSTINVAKRLRHFEFIPFLSAVLRQIENKWKEALDRIENEELKLCIINSFPYEFYKIIKEEWGEKVAKEIIKYSLKPPIDYIRVNLIKTSPENLYRSLEKKGFILEETEFFDVFRVKYKPIPLTRTEEYKKGYFVIQDLASASVAQYLDPKPDEKIVDMTAAPGNKTFHVASLTDGKAKIVAVDWKCNRLKKMKQIAKRLGIKNIEYKCMDARKIQGKFDKAIVDPTCTSTGTFQKYPEVKVFFKYIFKRKEEYVRIQKELLDKAVKIAETVSYSVCSLLKEEGEENAHRYKVKKERRFWPWDQTIGFYVAIIEI